MQRISFKIIVSALTFIIGIITTTIWRNLPSNLNSSPAKTISVRLESSPVAEKYCEVHGVTMFKEHVPILWGYAPISASYELWKGYGKAHRSLFPNTNRYISGGCVRDETTSDEAYVCQKCREAEALWVQQAGVKGK